MPYAATLLLDEVGAVPVRAMWLALAEAGLARDALDLGYRPHLTLGLWQAAVPSRSLKPLAARWPVQPLRLAGFGVFPGGVLWLAPVVTASLLACHAELHAALPEVVPHPHYAPGAWVPHVTLSARVDATAALPLAAKLLPPAMAASLDRLELVRFPPVEVLKSWRLSPAG